jgi:hypothetical protein
MCSRTPSRLWQRRPRSLGLLARISLVSVVGPTDILAAALTCSTAVATRNHQIQSIHRRLLNPRRPNRKVTAEEQEEFLVPYDPALPYDPKRVLSHHYEACPFSHASLFVTYFLLCQGRKCPTDNYSACSSRIDVARVRIWPRHVPHAGSTIEYLRCSQRELQQGPAGADCCGTGGGYHVHQANGEEKAAEREVVPLVCIRTTVQNKNYSFCNVRPLEWLHRHAYAHFEQVPCRFRFL